MKALIENGLHHQMHKGISFSRHEVHLGITDVAFSFALKNVDVYIIKILIYIHFKCITKCLIVRHSLKKQ